MPQPQKIRLAAPLANTRAGESQVVRVGVAPHTSVEELRFELIQYRGSFSPDEDVRVLTRVADELFDGNYWCEITIYAHQNGKPVLRITSMRGSFPSHTFGPYSLNREVLNMHLFGPHPPLPPCQSIMDPPDDSEVRCKPPTEGLEQEEVFDLLLPPPPMLLEEDPDEDEEAERLATFVGVYEPETDDVPARPSKPPRRRGLLPFGAGILLLLIACFAPLGLSMKGRTPNNASAEQFADPAHEAPTSSETVVVEPEPEPAHEQVTSLKEPEPLQAQEVPPRCTRYTRIHLAEGGHPSGCYLVGCQEGYVQAKQWSGETWIDCPQPIEIPSNNTCFQVTDSDNTAHTVRFTSEGWKHERCTL